MSINKAFADEGYLVLNGTGLLGVRAQLQDKDMAAAASFRKGQKINLVCNGAGRVLTVTALDHCEPLAAYVQDRSPAVSARVRDILNGREAVSRSTGSVIAGTYEMALLLPAGSPCLSGTTQSCETELKNLNKDPSNAATLKKSVNRRLATLKME